MPSPSKDKNSTTLLIDRLWFIMSASAAVGAILFVAIYGIRILDPTYEDWLFEGGDLTQHYLGWLYFRRCDWQFPIGLFDGVFGRIKISMMYTDSVPLFAFFLKLLSPLLPDTFQYFGLLGLLTFLLNGASSSLLIRRFNSNGLFCIIGSIVFILSPVVLQRLYGHETLACHFVIFLGLVLWMYQDHSWQSKRLDLIMPPLLWGALGVLAVGIHMYYLPMIYCFLLGSFITDRFRNKNTRRPALCFISLTVLSVITMWLLGAFYNDADISAQGIGLNSANINTFYNPIELGGNGMIGYPAKGSIFLDALPVNNGQYEGYAYLGLGVIAGGMTAIDAAAFRIIRRKGRVAENFKAALRAKRIWLIAGAAVFAVSMVFALSPSGFFDGRMIYDIYYSEKIISFMASFRATGRFAWVGMYLIFTSVMYGLSRISHKKLMLTALVICTALQVADLSDQIHSRRWYKEEHTYTFPLADPRWEKLAEGCNKFIGLSYDQPQPYVYAFSIFAYRHGMTVNHFHVARPPLDEIIEQYNDTIAELNEGNADPDALYVFISDEYIPKADGEKVYELDGFFVVKFPNQSDPLS